MELREGYKQTEVGVIPEDWGVEVVKNAYEIRNNLRLPLSESVRKGMQGAYPYYGPTKIQGYINEYRVEGEYCLIGEDGDHFLKWQSMPMTILVHGKFNVNNHAHLVRGIKNETVWFYYYFNNRDITKHLTRQGAGRYKLTKASLEDIPLAIPPTKTEQTAIANALSDADALIQSLTRLIAKKRQIKQGAMQTLLNPYGNGRLKAGWVVKKLGDVAPLQRGFDLPNSQLVPGKYPVVYSNGVSNYHCRKQVSGPGVVTGRSGTLGVVHYIESSYWPHNTTLWVTNFFGSYPKYIYYLFKSIGFSRFGTGSGVPTLNRNDAHAFVVGIPNNITEQTRIATILSDMDADIAALETKLAKTQHIKQGMMQNLLTGRIRLV